MLSILQVISIKQRKSCIRNGDKDKMDYHVHWSRQVDEMQKKHKISRQYPKQMISRKDFELTS